MRITTYITSHHTFYITLDYCIHHITLYILHYIRLPHTLRDIMYMTFYITLDCITSQYTILHIYINIVIYHIVGREVP